MSGEPAAPAAATWSVRLARPTDVASLVVFRIAFGLLAAIAAYHSVSANIVDDLWAGVSVHLPWGPLAALAAPSGEAAEVYFLLLALVGLAVAVGFCFRASCIVLAAGWLYPVATCPTAFLTTSALTAALALLLAFSPAHRRVSADAWLRPGRAGDWGPAWPLLAIRVQLALVQLSCGLALLNGDWLRGYPLRLWLPARTGMPLLGWIHQEPSFALAMSWLLPAALLLGSLALWLPGPRRIAFAVLTLTLLWLGETFVLGTLPWLLIVGNSLFFAASWPRRAFHLPPREDPPPAAPLSRPAAGIVAAALALQLPWLPLPWLDGGGQSWHGVGYGSPWRLVARSKGGVVQLVLRDPQSDESIRFDPELELTGWQYRRVATHPELLRRYVHRVAARVEAAGRPRPEVRALTLVTLNGREPQRLLDPTADLAAAEDVGPLLLPLEVPLERQWQGHDDWPGPLNELPTRRPESGTAEP